jgi:hypothetical protein
MPKQTSLKSVRDKKRVFRFGSKTKDTGRLMSNFHRSNVVLRKTDFSESVLSHFKVLRKRLEEGEATFTSSEAAWQALKAGNLKTFRRFEKDGDIGKEPTLESFLPFLPKSKQNDEECQKKYAYWIKNKNGTDFGNIGIIPKMAVKKQRFKALGLESTDIIEDNEFLPTELEEDVWMTILRAKAKKNYLFWNALNVRHGFQFIELSIGAKRRYLKNGTEDYWAGYNDNDTGIIYGKNRMGEIMEKLAKELYHKWIGAYIRPSR